MLQLCHLPDIPRKLSSFIAMAFLNTHFFADSLGMCTRCNVLLPDRPKAGKPIPALYLLHGLSDDETIWMRRTSLELFVNKYYLAVIMPCGDRSFYSDLPNGSRYFQYISDELPRLMEGYFPLRTDRAGRFIAGLSMGGFGTFKTAFARPDRYAAAAAMSAVCDIAWVERQRGPLFSAIYGDAPLRGSVNDLFEQAKRVAALPAAERPLLFQYCGVDDGLFADNVRLREHLRALGYAPHWVEGPGGHCWENWNTQIQNILAWLPLEENQIRTGAIGI